MKPTQPLEEPTIIGLLALATPASENISYKTYLGPALTHFLCAAMTRIHFYRELCIWVIYQIRITPIVFGSLRQKSMSEAISLDFLYSFL